MSTSKPTEGTLDAKLERMLANWEKPAVRSVMLPGTQMTCDEAAAAIRAALTGTVEPVQVKPDWLVNTTKRVGEWLADYDNNVSHDHEEGDPTDDNLSEFDRDDIRTLLAALAPATLSNPEAPAAPVAWRVRERPGFEWGLVRTDPDRDPHFHCWEKQPLFATPALVATPPAQTARRIVELEAEVIHLKRLYEDEVSLNLQKGF
ncbi:hypothetical protein NKH17_12695 [Mesorhizobium sp. M1334]|uniref:hypothetical protein n=1 Tax=Mesorhizobium sp. M1334 TaxID=2957084 RepID=UPI003335322A